MLLKIEKKLDEEGKPLDGDNSWKRKYIEAPMIGIMDKNYSNEGIELVMFEISYDMDKFHGNTYHYGVLTNERDYKLFDSHNNLIEESLSRAKVG